MTNPRDAPVKPARRHPPNAAPISDNEDGGSDDELAPIIHQKQNRQQPRREAQPERSPSPTNANATTAALGSTSSPLQSRVEKLPGRNTHHGDGNAASNHTSRVPTLMSEEAETTIGEAVKMVGELSFERLLRIDGAFEGKLISKGSLIVGAKGVLKGNIENMKELIVDGGVVIGHVSVDKLTLRSKGRIQGNVTTKSIRIDPECTMVGTLNVHALAPAQFEDKPKGERKENSDTNETPLVKKEKDVEPKKEENSNDKKENS